ncbi:MAG TPA: sialidase family protein, partial [Candidatus Thermoplasmatota archaeon]|nr:sialidase family protein [Candidatus Thermoplasmatota archaeon]
AVVKSLDGGKTWPIKTFVPGDRCLRGNLARAPDGTLYLGGCDAEGPGVAISTDGGLSFTWTNVAKREGETTTAFCVPCHLFTVVTTDAAGNAYAVWSDESQAPDDPQGPGDGSMGLNVWMVSSTDRGASWSAPKRVNNAPGTYVLPWATGGADGKLAIAYYGTRFVGHPERAMGEWYPIVAFTEDALADAPVFIESSASPTLAQYGPVCMRGSGCGNARNLLDFFQIQADSEGRIHMAFTDGTPGGTARASIIAYGRQVGGLTLGGPSVDKNGGPGAARAILPVPTV